MKLTRKQLRKLIIETLEESKYYIGNPKGGVTRAEDAWMSAEHKDEMASKVDPKIADLIGHEELDIKRVGRELANTLADPESEFGKLGPLTPEEETAYDHLGLGKSSEYSGPEDIKQTFNDPHLLLTLQSQDRDKLNSIGFTYIADLPFGPETDYDDWGDQFRFQAKALGCEVEDMAFIDTEESLPLYRQIIEMIKASGEEPIPIPGDMGYYGHNELYDLNGVKILTTGQMGGYYTIKICG